MGTEYLYSRENIPKVVITPDGKRSPARLGARKTVMANSSPLSVNGSEPVVAPRSP